MTQITISAIINGGLDNLNAYSDLIAAVCLKRKSMLVVPLSLEQETLL